MVNTSAVNNSSDVKQILREHNLSQGPYTLTAIEDDEKQVEYYTGLLKFGRGRIWGIGLPSHPQSKIGPDELNPEHLVTMLLTGNGPNSENNARGLIHVLQLLPRVIELLENTEDELQTAKERYQRAEAEAMTLRDLEKGRNKVSRQDKAEKED